MRRAEQLDATLEETTGSQAGRVRLAAPGAFLRTCIAPRLPAILRANPALELELKVDDIGLDSAAEGIDVAIRFGSLDRQPGVIARRLVSVPWVLCATRRYADLLGAPATPAELEAHRQIGYREPATGQLVPWQFAAPGSGATVRLLPRKRLVVEDLSVAWAMVSRGLGIGWLPAWGGLKELESGHVIELLRDWRMPETPIHAVQLDRKQMPSRVRTLIDLLAAWAPSWAYNG